MISKESRILVAGARGMVGSAIVRKLKDEGFVNVLAPYRQELDYLNQASVDKYFYEQKIDAVYFAAAKVGGILANDAFQADFLYQNITMAANTIHSAAEHDVKKFLFLGSSCIYPRLAPQPLKEEYLLGGPLEPTNEGYAIAKIAGLKLCEMYKRQYGKNFISAVPANLYGSGDNFHPDHSHVIPGMMRRFHEAKTSGRKEVIVWGSGSPKREFLHVDDLASALLLIMENYDGAEAINVGTGEDLSIREIAMLMREVTGFEGEIVFDSSKPDGAPRKVLDVSRLQLLGVEKPRALREGLSQTYDCARDEGLLSKAVS